LQGPLYNLWTPGSWLSDQIWKITCVSIAAQLATFALGLLYFHQFPNYFLFSNLFVIPLSFVVLVAGLGVVMFDIVPYVGKIIGFVFDLSIQVMNWAVVKIEQMPFSIIEGVYITTFQCWLLIVVVICIILLFEQRKFVYIGVASMLIILFSLIQWRHYINTNDPVLVVYRVAGSSAFDIITCNHAYFSTDTVLMKDQERIRFHVLPNRIMRSVGQVINIDNIPSKKMEGITLYRWNGITLLHVFSKPKDFPNLPIDYVLVSNNAIDKPIPGLNPQWYILDSSNSFYLNRKFKSASGSDSLRIFSVLEEGAFIEDLKKL
jgi:competence protein ComEC